MNRILKDIKGCSVRATDGDIGKVTDCYFDEESWVVRYLVVDTGGWLSGREVLISPMSVQRLDFGSSTVHLSIDRARVKGSPSYDVAEPISREYETKYYAHYGYPYYWGGTGLWGAGSTPAGLSTARPAAPAPMAGTTGRTPAERVEGESGLRSAREVGGYHIRARDEEVGHVEDFLLEPDSWRVDSLIIDTSNMPGGKPVTLSSERVKRIDWSGKKVFVNATSEEIRNSPEFRPEAYTTRY